MTQGRDIDKNGRYIICSLRFIELNFVDGDVEGGRGGGTRIMLNTFFKERLLSAGGFPKVSLLHSLKLTLKATALNYTCQKRCLLEKTLIAYQKEVIVSTAIVRSYLPFECISHLCEKE